MMSLVSEIDYGTPRSKVDRPGDADHRRRCAVTVPAGTSIMRAAMEMGTQDPEALRDRHGRGLRLLPPVPGRDRGARRHAGLLHDAGRAGHGRPHPDRAAEAAAPRRDGALHLRPPARLPDLRGQRRLRAAGHGRRGRPARGPLRLRRQPTTPIPARTSSNPYFTYDPSKCIVCSRCVRACEEVQGTFALTIAGRGFDSVVSPGMRGAVPRVRVRLVRRLRPGLPDGDADREVGHRDRHARALGRHHLRLLRRRLHLQGRDARRRGRAHGALQGRQGEPRPLLRQGPLRLGLCHPPGPHPEADDPREDRPSPWREVSWDEAIGHVAVRVQAHPGEVRRGRRSAASPRRAAPTRRPSSSRSWCAPASATTTSTPAPASAIRRPATA